MCETLAEVPFGLEEGCVAASAAEFAEGFFRVLIEEREVAVDDADAVDKTDERRRACVGDDVDTIEDDVDMCESIEWRLDRLFVDVDAVVVDGRDFAARESSDMADATAESVDEAIDIAELIGLPALATDFGATVAETADAHCC